jgi:sugar O-acyltransferase (sialic acid O-acetyltransferase NeuD family)
MINYIFSAIEETNLKEYFMNERKVLVVGSSGHAKVIIDIFERTNIEIIGVIDDYRNKNEKTLGYSVLGKVQDVAEIIEKFKCSVFIAIGDNYGRQLVMKKIKTLNSNVIFSSAIHPSALIGKNVSLGEGVALMAGSIVNADAKIGDFAFINTNASADHDVEMSNFSSLAPGVTVGGNVKIGECSAISIGATLKENIVIGSHSVIGAGSLLMKNCPDNVVMYGVPAIIVRDRKAGDKYV